MKSDQSQQRLLPPSHNYIISQLSENETSILVTTYMDMLNQENDLFYLFDSFHSVFNALKQAYNLSNHPAERKVMAQGITSSSRDTIDWWKATNQPSNANWTGLKNLQPLNKSKNTSKQDSWIDKLSDSRFTNHFTSQGQSTIQNNASKIIDKLKKEIGELTDEQKHNQSVRSIFGVQDVQLFTEERLRESLLGPNKKLLSIYQLQNKNYKCHLGFCLVQMSQDSTVLVQKFYIAKYIRKHQNYLMLVTEVIRYMIQILKGERVKLKVNSSQGELVKLFFQIGFKLTNQHTIIGDLKIITLTLYNKEFKG